MDRRSTCSGAGRYTLETQNIPKLGKVINKTVQMAIKWVTGSKIRFFDHNIDIPLEIGACGELNLVVSDSRKLLVKLVGTMRGIAWGENGVGFTKSIQNAFRLLISTAVKANLSNAIKSNNIITVQNK